MSDPIRVLLAKPTHDCHDRGVRYVARKMRDAGFEVIFTNFLLPDEIVNTAVEEDVQVIGVSSSSGGHMPVFEDLIAGLKSNGLDDIFLLGGGVIPEDDAEVLRSWGVKSIFGPGATAEQAIEMIAEHFGATLSGAASKADAGKREAASVNPAPFKHIAILGGAGLMGHGIALACLQGCDARISIISRRKESVAHGLELIELGPFGLKRGIERGKLTAEQAAEMQKRLSGTTDYAEGLEGADLVFETIPEAVAVKHAALTEAESRAPDAVIATNTSSIMISELAAPLKSPGRLVGTHWFYPSNVMPLVEVARSELTDPANLDRIVAFLIQIGKKPVVVSDSPGFFMTRFINNYIAEAIRLVELGIAGPAEIDEMCKTGLGWPMGIFELLDDAAAFDSFYQAQSYLHETCGERYAIPPLARKVFLAGYKGNPKLKPGSRGGFYDFLGIKRPEKAKKS